MKILDAQDAVLPNVEVLDFLNSRRASLARARPPRKGPGIVEKAVKEVTTYLTTAPSPLSQKPVPFRPADIPTLFRKLHRYNLTKGELCVILNLRPFNTAGLYVCVGEVTERFTDDEQQEILDIVAEVLGSTPAPAEAVPAANGAHPEADADPVKSIEDAAT